MKYETNRVTGKPNMRKTRVENRKEGKPWRANCREFIWQLVAVPKAQPGFSATASSGRFLLPLWELAMARLPQWSGFEVARVLELLCLPFSSKGGRCTLHCIQIESTHSYCDCVCQCGDGVAGSSVAKCVWMVKRARTVPGLLWNNNKRAAGNGWSQWHRLGFVFLYFYLLVV